MMNDTEIDLGQWKKKNSKPDAGADADANTKADIMNFVWPDTLAELVWSPQTGLNIKFVEKKPCAMLEDGPSETRRLDTQNEPHIASLASPHVDADNIEHEDADNIEIDNVNLLNKRKRKCSLEQQLVFESKRIKKQVDHSFMNWISNMSKGFKSRNIFDKGVNVSNETGFQNDFQSLISPETTRQIENKSIGSLVLNHKQVSLYEGLSKEEPKGMFDTIRRLRLSRSDIHKWMDSQLPVTQLDGFFLRLRVAKRKEGSEGPRYYVGCITGLQWETPWKDLKQPIRVKFGGVECFVESQHISNCDFIEDELIAWWQKTSENQRIEVKDLKSKLDMRRTLGM